MRRPVRAKFGARVTRRSSASPTMNLEGALLKMSFEALGVLLCRRIAVAPEDDVYSDIGEPDEFDGLSPDDQLTEEDVYNDRAVRANLFPAFQAPHPIGYRRSSRDGTFMFLLVIKEKLRPNNRVAPMPLAPPRSVQT